VEQTYVSSESLFSPTDLDSQLEIPTISNNSEILNLLLSWL